MEAIRECNFGKITLFLQEETDFLACGNHFFSSIFRFSCHRYLQFSVSWKRVFKRVLHYGQWKRIFWLLETIIFLSIFQTFMPVIVFSRLVETCFRNEFFILASGNHFPAHFYHKPLIPSGEIRMFVYQKQHYFIYSFFFCLRKTLLAHPFPLARMNDFLEKHKKHYHWQESLKNREKKWFPLARKLVAHLRG